MKLEEWRMMGADLQDRLRLPTYPVAIKYIKESSAIPTEAIRPSHGNQKWSICQAFTYARRWGWTTAMTVEENFCVPVVSAFEGFGESCVKGGLLPFITGRPQVVIPGMGDRVFAGIGDNEVGIGLPGAILPRVMAQLFKTGGRQNMGQPVKTLLPMGLTESITPGFQFLKEKIEQDKAG